MHREQKASVGLSAPLLAGVSSDESRSSINRTAGAAADSLSATRSNNSASSAGSGDRRKKVLPRRKRAEERGCLRKLLWLLQLWGKFACLVAPAIVDFSVEYSVEYVQTFICDCPAKGAAPLSNPYAVNCSVPLTNRTNATAYAGLMTDVVVATSSAAGPSAGTSRWTARSGGGGLRSSNSGSIGSGGLMAAAGATKPKSLPAVYCVPCDQRNSDHDDKYGEKWVGEDDCEKTIGWAVDDELKNNPAVQLRPTCSWVSKSVSIRPAGEIPDPLAPDKVCQRKCDYRKNNFPAFRGALSALYNGGYGFFMASRIFFPASLLFWIFTSLMHPCLDKNKNSTWVKAVRATAIYSSFLSSFLVTLILMLAFVVYGVDTGGLNINEWLVIAVFLLPMGMSLLRGDKVSFLLTPVFNLVGLMWIMPFVFSFQPWHAICRLDDISWSGGAATFCKPWTKLKYAVVTFFLVMNGTLWGFIMYGLADPSKRGDVCPEYEYERLDPESDEGKQTAVLVSMVLIFTPMAVNLAFSAVAILQRCCKFLVDFQPKKGHEDDLQAAFSRTPSGGQNADSSGSWTGAGGGPGGGVAGSAAGSAAGSSSPSTSNRSNVSGGPGRERSFREICLATSALLSGRDLPVNINRVLDNRERGASMMATFGESKQGAGSDGFDSLSSRSCLSTTSSPGARDAIPEDGEVMDEKQFAAHCAGYKISDSDLINWVTEHKQGGAPIDTEAVFRTHCDERMPRQVIEAHYDMITCVAIYNEKWSELELTLNSLRVECRRAYQGTLIVVLVDGVIRDNNPKGPEIKKPRQIVDSEVFARAQGRETVHFGEEDAYWSRFEEDEGSDSPDLMSHVPVDILYVVKRHNAGKADTHHRFFEMMRYLEFPPEFVCLTDTGTIIGDYCIDRLVGSLNDDKRLIATTARQRAIMWRGLMRCLMSDRLFKAADASGRLYSAFSWLWSPASIQAGEFEQTFMLNMDAFNLIKHLPILPGPLQCFRYAPLKDYGVDEIYKKSLKDEAGGSGFQRFLFDNARLAEDRFLSFFCVAATGMDSKWVNGGE